MLTVQTGIKLLVTEHSEYLRLVFVCQSLVLQNILVNIWKASGMCTPAGRGQGSCKSCRQEEKRGLKDTGRRREGKEAVNEEKY